MSILSSSSDDDGIAIYGKYKLMWNDISDHCISCYLSSRRVFLRLIKDRVIGIDGDLWGNPCPI